MSTDVEADRRARARARALRMTTSESPLTSSERVALAYTLTRAAWAVSGQPWPEYTRATIPIRIIRPPR